jgi:hypothetical protein
MDLFKPAHSNGGRYRLSRKGNGILALPHFRMSPRRAMRPNCWLRGHAGHLIKPEARDHLLPEARSQRLANFFIGRAFDRFAAFFLPESTAG